MLRSGRHKETAKEDSTMGKDVVEEDSENYLEIVVRKPYSNTKLERPNGEKKKSADGEVKSLTAGETKHVAEHESII